MDRRKFIKRSLTGGLLASVAPATLMSCTDSGTGSAAGTSNLVVPDLKICFQENTAPGKTLEERLDYMEANGVVALEPYGKELGSRVEELKKLLSGRKIEVSAICAGFSGFILAEDPAVKAEFDRTMRDIIAAAGELGSTGVIMVPAFNQQLPVKPHTIETRQYLVDQLRELGDYAVSKGTTVILEPLNRTEAFYLRQVADAASICRDADHPGVKCMGDFWHMTAEETSDYGAFFSGGEYLQHVHIASRRTRKMPGEDGAADNYVAGFYALQQLNYPYYVSFECGTNGVREETVPAALNLMRNQWEEAKQGVCLKTF